MGRLAANARKVAALVFPRYFFRRIMGGRPGSGCPYCIVSFDCDFPRDVEALPRLLPLLQRYGIRASFACIGQWVRRYPDEHRLLVEAGYEILNHTETHPNLYHPDYDYARADGLSRTPFNRIGPRQRREEIERGHATLAEILGVEPVGFRTPHFGALHVDDVYGPLVELGYRFSSSVMAAERGGAPYRTGEGLWEIPVSPCPLHPCGVFDSWHALGKRGASHCGPGELADLFAVLADAAAGGCGLVNVYFDPKDVLESGELERVLAALAERDIELVDYAGLVDALEKPALPPDSVQSIGAPRTWFFPA
ncbi:MAG: polysaccharide deacetylase family protein [Candidatus Latescibacterota bacterium]|nr:polysaccharide deacetylase family protein [Candidatus Latescibacterota bacterium]